DQSTNYARVTLVGLADPNISLSLLGTTAGTVASNTGLFQFPDVRLALGPNPLTVRATNRFGRSADFTLTIQRVMPPVRRNAVWTWNEYLLDAVRLDASPPPVASRAMAMVHTAILDAVNAIQGTPAYAVRLTAPVGASAEAAVAAAAERVLSF